MATGGLPALHKQAGAANWVTTKQKCSFSNQSQLIKQQKWSLMGDLVMNEALVSKSELSDVQRGQSKGFCVVHSGCGCKMEQPPWKPEWQFPKRLNMRCDPAIHFRVYTQGTESRNSNNTSMKMLIAALFTIAQR